MPLVERMKTRSTHCLALLVALPLLLLACGCDRSVASRDRQERRDPELQRARAMRMKPSDAMVAYRVLLDASPTLALAHLDFALLLHDHARDLVGAIYHYRRYLELRPKAEKRDLIEHRIRKAQVAFAAIVTPPHGGGGVTNAPETQERDPAARMLEENAWLRVEVARLTQENEDLRAAGAKPPAPPAAVTPAAPTSAAASVSATPPAPPVPVVPAVRPPPPKPSPPAANAVSAALRKHRVQRGDTLGSIAETVYGDRRQWQRIFDANRELLKGNPNRIREGQVLALP
jgi:hypothetical protein